MSENIASQKNFACRNRKNYLPNCDCGYVWVGGGQAAAIARKIFFRRQPSEFLFFLWYHLLSFTPQRLVSRQVLTTTAAQPAEQAAAARSKWWSCSMSDHPLTRFSLNWRTNLQAFLTDMTSLQNRLSKIVIFRPRFLSILPHLSDPKWLSTSP